MAPKARYKVENWKEYNEALVKRGDLSVWIDPEVLDGWNDVGSKAGRGRRPFYSDGAIAWLLTLRLVYRLPLRATEGLGRWLIGVLGRPLRVPDYSTLCRRQARLFNPLKPLSVRGGGPVRTVLVDSTGVKLYGEGEWKVREHGVGKRRKWMKLHLAIDGDTQEILGSALTDNDVGDSEVLGELLGQIQRQIDTVITDGAYDGWECRAAVHAAGAKAVIPPPTDAVINKRSDPPALTRNEAVVEIELRGRPQWKVDSGYHARSRVETAMFRFKTLIGERLRARLEPNQQAEAVLGIEILNRLTALGMPVFSKIE